ncbi:MAG: hypothetical protein WCL24_10540 [Verrucomicrobiota bacterium]
MIFVLPVLLFPLVALGLGWPLAGRLALDPAEKLGAAVVLSLLATYLLAFATYLLGLPPAALWALPLLGAGGLLTGRRALAALLADRAARALLTGLALVTVWCLGWLATIVSYSGGGWTSDWFEHWERLRFFLERWPVDTKFLGFGALPARPPLANLVTGALVAPGGATFAGYQLATTLLSCLAFLPAALLAGRFQRRGAGPEPAGPPALLSASAVLTVLLMLNPSFVQNATFAWTKLIAVFFILSGLYFFLRSQDPAAPPAAAPLCAVSLAAGLLAHYSAGPYVLLLAGAWCAAGWRAGAGRAWGRQTARLGLLGGLVLATWFGWSLAVYGAAATLGSNSSVAEAAPGQPLAKIALNLRDTLVPHFLRPLDGSLIAQRSPWGYARDWCFQLYQLNLPLMLGSLAWLVLARELVRAGRSAPAARRRFWLAFVGGGVVLGVAVHGARDHWGLGHICLQTLVVLGLAFLAARWPVLSRGARRVLVAGAVVDAGLGLALHFAVQSYALDRWLAPGQPPGELLRSYSDSAFMNLAGKLFHHLRFLADMGPHAGALALALLAVMLPLALRQAACATRPSD